MRILTVKKIVLAVFFTMSSISFLSAQNKDITIQQDQKFVQLLDKKRKMNASLSVDDHYKIQIYYGDNSSSRKILSDFKRDFKNLDGTIVFNTPIYKVWVGNFKTRIEAERNMEEVKKKYPNALLIQPNK